MTSSLGGYRKVNGARVPDALIAENGLADRLRSVWPQDAKVLMVCLDPGDHEKNDAIYSCFKSSFPLNGLRNFIYCYVR